MHKHFALYSRGKFSLRWSNQLLHVHVHVLVGKFILTASDFTWCSQCLALNETREQGNVVCDMIGLQYEV